MHREFYTRLISKEHPLPEAFVPEHLIDIGLPSEAAPGNPSRESETSAGMSGSQGGFSAFSRLPQIRTESLGCIRISFLEAPERACRYGKPIRSRAWNQ